MILTTQCPECRCDYAYIDMALNVICPVCDNVENIHHRLRILLHKAYVANSNQKIIILGAGKDGKKRKQNKRKKR